MPTCRPLRPVAADPKIALMNALELDGNYNRTNDGLCRSRQGTVGDAMMCEVAVLGSNRLMIFWAAEGDGYQRRFLVRDNGHHH